MYQLQEPLDGEEHINEMDYNFHSGNYSVPLLDTPSPQVTDQNLDYMDIGNAPMNVYPIYMLPIPPAPAPPLPAPLPLLTPLPPLLTPLPTPLRSPLPVLVARTGRPDTLPFAGELNFRANINVANVNGKKSKCLHSIGLNRMFVRMRTDFSVQYQWDSAVSPLPMYVRSTVVFSADDQSEKRVERCIQDKQTDLLTTGRQEQADYVLRSSRPPGSAGVYYCGSSRPDTWYSVLVEFSTAGPGPFSHAYNFGCKNSCPGGINRREIGVVFQLEDRMGKVYGRQFISVRVSASPDRDLKKDELAAGLTEEAKAVGDLQPQLPIIKHEEVTSSQDNVVHDPHLGACLIDPEDLTSTPPNISDIDDNLLINDEETMDVACKFIEKPPDFPLMPIGRPDTQEINNDVNFMTKVIVSNSKKKKKYFYSDVEKQLYTVVLASFPIEFKWNYNKTPKPMFIRSTVIFAQEDQAEQKVVRCRQHTSQDLPCNKDILNQPHILGNVLLSTRELGTAGLYYCGSDRPDSWYSVLVEFPMDSPGPFTHAYNFCCMNSCSTGINRRSIAIVFDLEDSTGRVYGRRLLKAKVSASPIRDMRNDEKRTNGEPTAGVKRPGAGAPPRGKRVKLEHRGTVMLPSMEVPDHETSLYTLRYLLKLMENNVRQNCATDDTPRCIAQVKANILELQTYIASSAICNPPQ